jgi:hypothetical protein
MSEAAKAIEAAFGEAAFEGDAHAFLMGVYKDTRIDIEKRIDAAKAAIRYEKPALSTIEARVEATVDALTEIRRTIVDPRN